MRLDTKNNKYEKMQITGTHFNYYLICHRKLWLFAHHVQMESTSDAVAEGKFIHESTYMQRNSNFRELEIGGIKIDFYDTVNKVIHEVKKSAKLEDAHVWQLKYYMYVLTQAGIEGVTGILEYPKQRQKEEILLSERDVAEIQTMQNEIEQIIQHSDCPSVINKPLCKRCAYYDFCYANEPDTNA